MCDMDNKERTAPKGARFKVTRTFAASNTEFRNARMSYAVPIDGPDYTVVTFHKTIESAYKTAKSSARYGYVGILKTVGTVEEL